MDTKYYETIWEDFKLYHPYMVKEVVDYRPRGDKGIRVRLKDDKEFDYDIVTHGTRFVKSFVPDGINDITDDFCRSAFSDHLVEFMTLKGFSQRTLAEYTGLGKGTIYNYINKRATPSLMAIRRIAHVLGCSISELVE